MDSPKNVPPNGESIIGLKFDKVSARRFDKLIGSNPTVASWPIITYLTEIRKGRKEVIEITPIVMDAIVSMMTFLSSYPDTSADRFAKIANRLILKIKRKGGMGFKIEHMADLVYEAKLQLLLEYQMPGFVEFPDTDDGNPDGVFVVTFQSKNITAKTALEFKNRRNHRSSEEDLVRDICSDIRRAIAQHKNRIEAYIDLVIFVDLPIGVGNLPVEYLHRTITNVWNQIELEGIEVIDGRPLSQTQVIFTMTSQSNIHQIILENEELPCSPLLLCPFVTTPDPVSVPGSRALFLSALFASKDQNANIMNWSQKAVFITESDQYLIQK